MKRYFGQDGNREETDWLSISDLMAGLMVVFLFVAIIFIKDVTLQNKKIEEIVVTWKDGESQLLAALEKEFEEDLPRWQAELERETLTIRFKAPEVLFERGRDIIKPKFKIILDDFFPRYINVLQKFSGFLEEIRIEGHTSSEFINSESAKDAYFKNMALSQSRTRAVLKYCLSTDYGGDRNWIRNLLTANGLSSSKLVLDEDGTENASASRRVEFRVRTKARDEIVKIIQELK